MSLCRGGKKLDNIVLRSEWFDESENFCEVRLTCETKFLTIYQVCYLFEDEMTKVLLDMDDYIENPNLARKIILAMIGLVEVVILFLLLHLLMKKKS